MIVSVASGKGGTGKTTVATSLALSLTPHMPVQFLDCDVEAPNAYLFLKPEIEQRTSVTLPTPTIDEQACSLCGRCAEVCQYHAITQVGGTVLVFPDLCHGCGSCAINCPERAIHEAPRPLGVLESGRVETGLEFAHGILDTGQQLAVPVIRQLRRWKPPRPDVLTIIDSPPGTSCPVVEAIRGVDFVLLVTEPTPFGLHDLRLAYQLAEDLHLPAGVIVNRDGIGDAGVGDFCADHNLPVLMRIPLDEGLAKGLAQGIPLVKLRPEYLSRFRRMYERIACGRREPA